MGAAPSRSGKTPVAFCGVFRLKRRGLPAPRWRGAHSASRQRCAKARSHALEQEPCRRLRRVLRVRVRASVGGGARSLSTMRHRRFQPVVFLVFSRGCQLPARGGTPQKRAKVWLFFVRLWPKNRCLAGKKFSILHDRPARQGGQ